MTKTIHYLLFIAILSASCQKKEAVRTENSSIQDQLDSLVNTVPDFSGVILFAEQGKPVFERSIGYRNFDTRIPIESTDIFELASVSKQFTAMTIMMLKEKGLLDYDELIEKYLPNLPYKGITIRHLLTHTSGLPDYYALMDEYWDKSKVATNRDIIDYLVKYAPPKNFEPGEKYLYSNTGYVLLGSITEAVAGQDFIDFCQQTIFDPLQMTSTGIRSNAQKDELVNMAYGHIFVEEKNKYMRADSFPNSNYTIWLGGRKGPGRVSSTAADLLKWDQALLKNELVDKATMNEAFTPTALNDGTISNYGFGWGINPDSELGKIVLHTGSNPGYKTIIVRYLDAEKTLIMLNNNAHPQFEDLRKTIDRLIADKINLEN